QLPEQRREELERARRLPATAPGRAVDDDGDVATGACALLLGLRGETACTVEIPSLQRGPGEERLRQHGLPVSLEPRTERLELGRQSDPIRLLSCRPSLEE